MRWPLVWLVALLLTAGPLVKAGYWPGFFYAPFYTTDVFTGSNTPAGQAGLRPEDRVVGANLDRIDKLWELQQATGKEHGSLSLLYELGRELTRLKVAVEPLGWERIIEIWGPWLAATAGLIGLGWRQKSWFCGVGGLTLLAGLDYWLNPGAGRLSGFDPLYWLNTGEWWRAASKWSAYLYWPLWTLTQTVAGYSLAARSGIADRKLKILLQIVIVTACLSEWAAYSYDAWKSGNYNNPDYIIWHARAVFWPEWGALVVLSGLAAWRHKNWWGLVSLLIFIAGFAGPTAFDFSWPGPGPQWYIGGLAGFAYWNDRLIARSNSAG